VKKEEPESLHKKNNEEVGEGFVLGEKNKRKAGPSSVSKGSAELQKKKN